MSAICTEFVQNAWKKDLCSNCFKAKADHATVAEPPPPKSKEIRVPPLETAPAKMPNEHFASSKRTILEMHKGMVSSAVTGKGLSGPNHNNNSINNNNNINNGNGVSSTNRFIKHRQDTSSNLHSSPRKIGSSGVHLWELGHMPDMGDLGVPNGVTNGLNGKETAVSGSVDTEGQVVSGILKDMKPISVKVHIAPTNGEPRRGSVGFIEGSPKVIGYGGNDYDWGDDQESSEEPSDVDSLENYDLTEEDKAFNQLTDRNTEYNADNTNLLLNQPVKPVSIFPNKATSLVDKLTPQSFYSMPASKITHKCPNASADSQPLSDRVQSFIKANMLTLGSEEPATFLDEEDSDPEEEDNGTMIVKTLPSPCQSARTGCETIPSRKYPSIPRTSVQQLFNEEPITAAELQAATKKLQPFVASPPLGKKDTRNGDIHVEVVPLPEREHSKQPLEEIRSLKLVGCDDGTDSCSPYGVVHIADIPEEDVQQGTQSVPPVIPSCPPPASDDETQKLPVKPKSNVTASSCKTSVGNLPSDKVMHNQGLELDQKMSSPLSLASKEEPCTSPKSIVGICSTFHTPSPKDTDGKFWNREYAVVNYSCHYASSYIKTGVSLPTPANSEKTVLSPTSTLPPTPLTNPYSSTAILKGLPRQLSSPERSPQKPPVTRPKPKLLAKPHVSPKIPEGGLQVQASEPVTRQTSYEHCSLKSFKADSPVKNSIATMDLTDATRVPVSCQNGEDLSAPLSLVESIIPANSDGHASPEIVNDQHRSRTSFDSKVASLTNALDFNKRGPKRQAPRPPTTSQDTQVSKADDRVSLSSNHSLFSPAPNCDSQMSSTRSTPHPTPDHRHPLPSATIPVPCDSTPAVPGYSASSTGSSTGNHSPIPANVMTTSTPNLPSYESHLTGKGSLHKEAKTKKSRFSLKKLLKFGSKEDHDDSKWKSRSDSLHHQERRTKLEILHPIDLINSARNDGGGNLPPSTPDNKSSTGTSSSSKASSIDSHHGCQSVTDEFQGEPDTHSGTNQGSVSFATDEQQSSAVARCKPPPPLRSRPNLDEPSKDKPVRPPPPAAKRAHTLTRGQALSDSSEDIHDSTPIRRPKNKSSGSLQHGDKRNSCYSTSMEYANLGDIRNNLAPKKPGRCVSSSMMDIAYMEQDSLNNSHRSTSHEDIYKPLENYPVAVVDKVGEVAYYEPSGDHWLEDKQSNDLDELYADHGAVATEQTEPSSIGSNPPALVSSESIKNGHFDAANRTLELDTENPVCCLESSDSCSKVYERVVLKRGNLEKVYAKFPVAADNSSTASTIVSDVEETIASDMGAVFWPRRKSSRLSLRKAKTVVHKNLEDNYGAVVSANHQTLTQILEQVTIAPHATALKIKLLEEVPPHWSDFKLLEDSQVTMVGDKAFYSAVWQQNVELTLMASQEPLCAASQSTRNPCVLVPIVEFEDAIPFGLFSKPMTNSEEYFCHGTVWVLERMRVETLSSVAESLHLHSKTDMEAYEREVCFILLQLINALKHLQVLGIEEVDVSCSDFMLMMKSNDVNYRLVILPKPSSISDGYRMPSSAAVTQEKSSLCQHALAVMFLLFDVMPHAGKLEIPSRIPSSEAFGLIAEILQQERATSLSQAKLLLEYLLWGPTDLNSEGRANRGGNTPTDPTDQELAYQRWLDLERATVLNNLIRTQSLWQIRLTVFEEYMLSFLVRTCAKMLREAAHQLQMNQSKNP